MKKAAAELRPGVSLLRPVTVLYQPSTQEFESFQAAIVYLKFFWFVHPVLNRWLFESSDVCCKYLPHILTA